MTSIMSTSLGLPTGAQILRTLADKGLWQKQFSEDVIQRLVVWFFGMTVIGQLWLWPLIMIAACTGPWWISVLLASYMFWILCGPGRKAAENEAPYHAPWRHLPVWQHMGNYLNARLIKTADLDPQGRYIFAAYPHGISAISGWVCFATEAAGFSRLFPGIRPWCMTLASNFKCPGIREYCLMYGLRSCERRSCISMLRKPGSAIVIYPGGAAEALVTEQGHFNLVLKRRKGFVRIAVMTGASLVPIFGFGETDLFETYVPDPHSTVAKLQRLSHHYWGTSQPVFKGSGIFTDSGLLPFRKPITTVVGAPIAVNKMDPKEVGEDVFNKAVDELHEKYVAALVKLFDDWKDKLAPNRKADIKLVA